MYKHCVVPDFYVDKFYLPTRTYVHMYIYTYIPDLNYVYYMCIYKIHIVEKEGSIDLETEINECELMQDV